MSCLSCFRWPLIIDRSAQAATFLRYRDTNYLNSLNTKQMEPNTVRLSLLGAIRYVSIGDSVLCTLFRNHSAFSYEITVFSIDLKKVYLLFC